jgi:hypothetical protein
MREKTQKGRISSREAQMNHAMLKEKKRVYRNVGSGEQDLQWNKHAVVKRPFGVERYWKPCGLEDEHVQ